MQGNTHKLGGAAAMVGMFEYLRLTGQTLEGVHPLLQLAIMYPASTFGSLFPDIDHHEGANPVNTPAGELFHKIVHLPDKIARKVNRKRNGKPRSKMVEKLLVVKHRAWQTHSIIFTGGISVLIWYLFSQWQATSGSMDSTICLLLMSGFLVGLASHIFLDMLTTSGVYLFMFKKVKLVPKSPKFATGSTWETKWVANTLTLIFTFFAVSIMLNIIGIDLIPLTWEVATDLREIIEVSIQ